MPRGRLGYRRRRGVTRRNRGGRRSLAARRPMMGSLGRLSKIVRRIANKGIEVKHVGQNVVNDAFNSSISAASECYPILPQVTEGTDGHQRIGDRINAKYLIVKGKLYYDNSVNGTYLPTSTVRVMILSQRNIKISSDVSSRVDVDHLLKDNIGTDQGRPYGSTAVPAQPNPFDNLAPINKDLFTVFMDRKFKMKEQMLGQLGNNNTVVVQGTQATHYFYKKIRCPKTLYFDDGNGNTPNNFAPFVCMGSVLDDNTGQWVGSTPYRLVVQAELYFTD